MTGIRRGAGVGLRYVLAIFVLGVVIQFFLVGYGLFAMHAGATIDDAKSLDAHRGLGWILGELGGGLILILSLISWPKPRLLGLYVALALLAFPVQPLLAQEGYHHKWIGMFHPVVALILLGLSGSLAHRAWAGSRAGRGGSEPAGRSRS
jgi:hypothetical protein